jgi:hypothetical protein
MSAQTVVPVEVWIVVDEEGNSAIGATAAEAGDAYKERHGADGLTRQMVHATVNVPRPKHLVVTANVPAPGDGPPVTVS